MKKLVLFIITFLHINLPKSTYHFIRFLIFLLVIQKMDAQCPQGDVIFYTQQGVDNFAVQYPDCTEINGKLTIGGSVPSNISDLSALAQINAIEGLLAIHYTDLSNLSGLDNLTTLLYLQILGNLNLQNLTGLENLISLESDLDIRINPSLTDISALSNLTSVGGIVLQFNYNLPNLNGLDNLNSVTSAVLIEGNNSLKNFMGLGSLNSIGGWLFVLENRELENFVGLDNLNSVGYTVDINLNEKLTSLDGLQGLNLVEDRMRIAENDILTSLMGLENIESIGGLVVTDNPNLSVCHVQGICNYLENSNTPGIQNNSSGCNSEEEVLSLCPITDIDNTHQSTFTVYPVPSKDVVVFDIPNIAAADDIILYDISGKQISRQAFPQDKQLVVSHLNDGVYIYRIFYEDEMYSGKIVVE